MAGRIKTATNQVMSKRTVLTANSAVKQSQREPPRRDRRRNRISGQRRVNLNEPKSSQQGSMR